MKLQFFKMTKLFLISKYNIGPDFPSFKLKFESDISIFLFSEPKYKVAPVFLKSNYGLFEIVCTDEIAKVASSVNNSHFISLNYRQQFFENYFNLL